MEQSKLTKKISKNTLMGILFKLATLVLALVSRSAFILFLTDEYLGVNGLYSNIFSVLSMADFGINAVMIYILYEPLVNEDQARLVALVKMFRKIYYGIALAIFALGALLIPLLPYIVSENFLSQGELIHYYLLFLINSAVSYLGAYKSTLLIADQKGYFVNATLFLSNFIRIAAQIAVLYLTHDFALYLWMMIAATVANNLILTYLANRRYPMLRQKEVTVDVSDVKPLLIRRTKSVFFYRMGGTLIDSTDNILISMLVGTMVVGYYSNYSMITTKLFALMGVLSQACMTGIGNFSVKAHREDKKQVYYTMQLVYFFMGAIVLCGILCVMNDFMALWLKEAQYVLSQGFVAILAVRQFLDIVISPNWVFRESQGLFDEAKSVRLWAAAANLVLSVLLGKLWGLSGIIAATALAKICTTVWFEPRIICRKVFDEGTRGYWTLYAKLLFSTALAAALSFGTCAALGALLSPGVLLLLAKALLCVLCTLCAFLPVFLTEKTYAPLKDALLKKLHRA